MDGIPFSTPDELDPGQYIKKALVLVRDEIVNRAPDTVDPIEVFEWPTVYVVWFAKTLQNWKALLSTSVPDGRYYELTYNGDKRETYMDVYVKESSHPISDETYEMIIDMNQQ